MKFTLILSIIISNLILFSFPIIGSETSVVSQLDLSRYQGQWFETARFPNFFQKKCQKNVKAHYRLLDKGFIEVINSCEQKNGKTKSVTGRAKQQGSDSTSKLEVSFFDILGWRPIWGDYWVLYIDADYKIAVIGDKNKKYGWILSRKTTLTKSQKDTSLAVLTKNGYDIQKLLFTTHD